MTSSSPTTITTTPPPTLGIHSSSSSHLLEPFKIIGLVTNHVVPAISFQSNSSSDDSDLIDDALIYCSIGNTFYAYGLKSLIHIDIGPQLPSPISFMLVERQSSLTSNASTAHPTQRDILYICCEDSSNIYVLRGARELLTIIDTSLQMHQKSGKLVQLLKIGQYLLVCFEHLISIYDTFDLKDSFVNAFELPKDCTLNCACHLQTYLDKIVIGCKEGHVLLFNFRVGKEIYRFEKHCDDRTPFSSSSSSQQQSLLHSLLEINTTQNNTTTDDNNTTTTTTPPPLNHVITCLKPSPALDVIAVGTSSGHVFLYHVKYDHILNVFKQNGPVSSISFRSTTSNKSVDSNSMDKTFSNHDHRHDHHRTFSNHSEHVMATGNHCGEVSLWDLNSHQLIHRIKKEDRHTHTITCCEFLPGEPFMVTCSSDNVMTLIAFDRVDKSREVVCRMGHKKSPKLIRFYDPMGHFIVTGGVDGQIRVTSLLDPRESKQISQQQNSHLWKQHSQMPAVTDMDICYLRQDDWNNLACCHSNLNSVTLWNVKYLKSDSETLYKPELKYGLPQSVALSICGNYAVVGTSKGYLEKWIIQSKKMKHLYHDHSEEQKKKNIEIRKVYDFKGRQKTLKPHITTVSNLSSSSLSLTAHSSPINSVVIDNSNTKVCSGGHDGLLKVWKFDADKNSQSSNSSLLNEIMNGGGHHDSSHSSKSSFSSSSSSDQLLASFDLKSPILKMVKSKHSASANFVSVACENFSIHIFDMNTCKLIRTFHGHHINKINDMCFTHDNRYLISCGSDNYILIYDILTGQLIDWLSLPKAATSVDFHPEGLHLVTTHVNSVGICLWANKTIFGNALLQSVNAPKYVSLPFSGDSLMITERTTATSSVLLSGSGGSGSEHDESLPTISIQKKKRKRAFKILSQVDDWMKERNAAEHGDDEQDSEEEEEDELVKKRQDQVHTSYPIQEPSHFIKLSDLPKYKWHGLTHLDEIRKRNKLDPKKPSIPELVDELDGTVTTSPFFLPTVSNLNTRNIQFQDKNTQRKGEKNCHEQNSENHHHHHHSHLVSSNVMVNPLIAMIKQDREHSNSSTCYYSTTMKYIKESSIKQLDLNIRTLSAFNHYEEYKLLLEFFLHFIQEEFTDFDLIQALMNLFFQIHSEVLVQGIRDDSEIRQFIERLSHANRVAFEPLDEMNKYNQCMIDYMSFGGVFI
ncbi:hypothetical protein FDP41_008162 [Naegleria fowleri]|uniref:Guanine nucleotide-binding protein subunit beta-like protein n=1 Tax=Naegleria fowleri TaxID=5763 RepID=A0A6A5BHF1_NAEFO|nr:uncharacterized protein FDP41_008162 [Naegleria fowleri]KAF0973458.1 hypothetical protein FDP41_008162 [Naegleria fowleri]